MPESAVGAESASGTLNTNLNLGRCKTIEQLDLILI